MLWSWKSSSHTLDADLLFLSYELSLLFLDTVLGSTVFKFDEVRFIFLWSLTFLVVHQEMVDEPKLMTIYACLLPAGYSLRPDTQIFALCRVYFSTRCEAGVQLRPLVCGNPSVPVPLVKKMIFPL